ncbi:hypothetical protein ISN44_As06g041830, partial [Arabidopsis suecica]
ERRQALQVPSVRCPVPFVTSHVSASFCPVLLVFGFIGLRRSIFKRRQYCFVV